ncbi:TonB-dependent receptor [Mucilaginibacter sp. FT3.2]|uniref:TonB-dependent receptor n=1 Tax=Mucilaginibacter sp. FT3.2 TaxID=2723090 RepID=UPI00161F5A32|nr:TonB-dependent receptor [Mucilaginibacter sp. FT3.2]MBB6234828.1 outer membrane receptor protein involved in Fe transport [Mucilaginibacter sp. FT3.2]
MKLKIAAFLAAWLSIASTLVNAQSGFTLSGKVKGADTRPLDGATIYLRTAVDSVLVKTVAADAAGRYSFVALKAGSYKLSVSIIGYETYKSQLVQLSKDLILPDIILQQAGKELKEVAVVAQKQLVEHKIDRTVVNVGAMLGNAGNTAMDVLEKSPGVMVDQNGAISLNGSGTVKIFIDDKPTYLSGIDLQNYLRSLSASSIDQVELMTNPPAKYDAAGSGGVINIRIKRNKVQGFNGSANLSYTQGRYGRTTNGLNFNYRNNKVNVFGNLSYNTNNNFNDLNINRYFLNDDGSTASNFLQNSFIRRKTTSIRLSLGADYYLSDKTTLGIGFKGLLNPGTTNTLNTSRLLDASNVLDSTIVANNHEHRNFKNGSVNLNYRHQYDKKGRELTIDVDQLNYDESTMQSFLNNGYLPNGNMISNDLLTGNLPTHIHIYSAKTDYVQPLNNGIKLETGLKTSYTKTDNVADYYYTVNNVTAPDYGKTNHFIYKEQINAGYINASKDWKRFSAQLGLRFENTNSDGHQLGNVQKPDSVFKRNYNGLFPTVYLQYKLDTSGHQSISLNYGRRIERPDYSDLNPFLSPLDKFTYYTGNPFLKPSYTNNFELSYNWKNVTTTLNYSNTKDDVNETIEIVNGIYYSRPGNLGNITVKGIAVDAGFDPAKWFNIHFYGRVVNIHSVSTFYTGTLNTQGTYFFVRPVLQFKLPKDWTTQLDGGYQSNITNAQFVSHSRGKVNALVSKKISPAITTSLAVNDIFYTFVNSGDINNLANTRANFHNVGDSRNVVLSFSYRFGKAISGLRKHDSNGAESEQNRVKN